jgi:hypothetical protein
MRIRLPQPGERLRYAVLRHTGLEREHFDLLLQLTGEEKLLTWRVYEPVEQWTAKLTSERVADHRAVYMTYEGPISGNRGEVKRVAEGAGHCLDTKAGKLRVNLDGIGEIALNV